MFRRLKKKLKAVNEAKLRLQLTGTITKQVKQRQKLALEAIGGIDDGGELSPAVYRRYYGRGVELVRETALKMVPGVKKTLGEAALEDHDNIKALKIRHEELMEEIDAGYDIAYKDLTASDHQGKVLAERFFNAGMFHALTAYIKLTSPPRQQLDAGESKTP